MNKLNEMMNERPDETPIEKHIREQINTMGHETEEVVTQVAIRICQGLHQRRTEDHQRAGITFDLKLRTNQLKLRRQMTSLW